MSHMILTFSERKDVWNKITANVLSDYKRRYDMSNIDIHNWECSLFISMIESLCVCLHLTWQEQGEVT
jgi:hypothetical protein